MLLKEPGHVLAFKGLRELLQGIILQGKNLHLAILRFQNLSSSLSSQLLLFLKRGRHHQYIQRWDQLLVCFGILFLFRCLNSLYYIRTWMLKYSSNAEQRERVQFYYSDQCNGGVYEHHFHTLLILPLLV